ncbi:hypothetical protein AMTRI_Chr04g244850 [Amborella trichopoda]
MMELKMRSWPLKNGFFLKAYSHKKPTLTSLLKPLPPQLSHVTILSLSLSFSILSNPSLSPALLHPPNRFSLSLQQELFYIYPPQHPTPVLPHFPEASSSGGLKSCLCSLCDIDYVVYTSTIRGNPNRLYKENVIYVRMRNANYLSGVMST